MAMNGLVVVVNTNDNVNSLVFKRETEFLEINPKY